MNKQKKFMRGLMESTRNVFSQGLGAILIAMLALGGGPGYAWAKTDQPDLTQLSLEDLMDIEITSVSKKLQRLSEAAAAVYVITQEDLRRSGVTNIPEALRMVPGIQVAKIDANKWAITARGFNGRFATKLLVLMDGRSVYTPLFSGVFWEDIDTPLEDIDRIEVIRGPGASLWGANAVNGVINIITKTAADTQGGLLTATVGSEERAIGTVRYGGKISPDTPYRIYLKYNERDSAQALNGGQGDDEWDFLRSGFRIDHESSAKDAFVVQGDIYSGSTGETITEPSFMPPFSEVSTRENDHRGFNILGRWSRVISDGSDFSLQTYYDRSEYTLAMGDPRVDTFDIDFQHRFEWGSAQEIIWGLGYRFIHDEIEDNPAYVRIDSSDNDLSILNAFIQDEITLIDKTLNLTLGSKFEYNDYTNLEIQPTARLLWKPTVKQSLWASISRAVRIPSRGEHDIDITERVLPPGALFRGSPVTEVRVIGNRDQESETLIAYELGYRIKIQDNLSLDAAAYYNDYDKLRNTNQGMPYPENSSPQPRLVLPASMSNGGTDNVYGFELAADYRPWSGGRLQGAYTLTKQDSNDDTQRVSGEPPPPEHQLSLRAGIDLPKNFELDFWWRYVNDLGHQVDSYHTLDIKLGWRLNDNLELAIVGQNLIDNHHLEFLPEFIQTDPTEVERGVYGKVTWTF